MKELQDKTVAHFKRHKSLWLKSAYVIVGLILLGVLTDGMLMPIWTRQGADTMVPNIVGLDYEKAADSLQRSELKIEKIGEKYDPNSPEGTVIFQLPDADSRVKKGRYVKVTLSRGGETVIVPQLAGQTLEQAELTLSEWGLRLGEITRTMVDTLTSNTVVTSYPQSGSKVPAGMIVNLVVNEKGEVDSTDVPELIGRNLAEARRILGKKGLRVDKIKRRVDEALLPETVIAQSIAPGEKVPLGTEIDLIISILEE